MGGDNPNAQIEANLLEGKGRYASAGTTLQDIKKDLDTIAAGLQSSWLGGASQDYQDYQGKLTTTVNTASDVLQKGSTSIGKMYDSYIEADEKQKEREEKHETMQTIMGVFIAISALLGIIAPILELADVVFATEIGALDLVVGAGDLGTDVAADTSIAETDTLTTLDNVSNLDDINVPNDETLSGVDSSSVSDGTTTPLDTPQDTPVDTPQDTPLDTPNVDAPSGEPTQAPPRPDSGIDLGQDGQDILNKLLNEPTVFEAPKDIAPQEPITVNMARTEPDGLGITMDTADAPPPQSTVSVEPQQETFTDANGNTTVVNIDTEGNETITVTDANGNTTVTTLDPETGFPQTTETFTDAEGDTMTIHTTIEVDPVDRSVIETETVTDDTGSQTITETVTATDGTQTVDVTTVESETLDDGTTIKTVTKSNGDTAEEVKVPVTDPLTGEKGYITTLTSSTTDSQGLTTVTEAVTNTDGTTTVTTIVRDQNGTILSTETNTIPASPRAEGSGSSMFDTPSSEDATPPAGPSQPPKRPRPDDSSPEAGPPTKKGKERA